MIRRMLVPTKLNKNLLRFRTTVLTDFNARSRSEDGNVADSGVIGVKRMYERIEEKDDELEEGEVYMKRTRVIGEVHWAEKRLMHVDGDIVADGVAGSDAGSEERDDEKRSGQKRTSLSEKKYFLYDSTDTSVETEEQSTVKQNKNHVHPLKRPVQASNRRTDGSKQSNYRSQVCKFFLTHSCTKGDACSYSHDVKRFPCKAFHVKRNCTRKNCMFSHEPVSVAELNRMAEDERRDTSDFVSPF